MTKWFVTDMDGTFLNNDRKISPRSYEVIKRVKEKGSDFFIATGRIDLAVRGYYNSIGLDGAVISCNGALVRNLKTGEIIHANEFNYDQLKIIFDNYKKYTDGSVEFHIYTTNYIYCETISVSLARILRVEEGLPEHLKTPMQILSENFLETIIDNEERCFKIMMISKNHDVLLKIYEETRKSFDVEGTFSASNFFDIMPKGATKGEGVRKVAEYYGYDMKESVVFGDNMNDIDMLTVAGTSICPSNARQEIQQLCNEVIGNNNDFAVLDYIEKYIDSI